MATVYLIDHELAQCAVLRAGLEADGLAVVNAEEAGDWLAQARALKPACIVLAVELVGISGYSVCNKLKRDRELAALPLLLVSSQASPETFAEHARLKTHADAYAHKPYDVDAVREVVRGLMQRAAAPAPMAAASAGATPSVPSTRRPARFGEEPSVIEPMGSPFFAAEGSATQPVAEFRQPVAAASAPVEGEAPLAQGPLPPAVTSSAEPASPEAPEENVSVAVGPSAPAPAAASSAALITDAQILLERAVDTQNQTRIYDTLAQKRSDAQRPSHADLIAAALGDIDAALGAGGAQPHGGVTQLPPGEPGPADESGQAQAAPDQLAVLRAELAAERARVAQLQLERDRALSAREAQAATLERLRQLLG